MIQDPRLEYYSEVLSITHFFGLELETCRRSGPSLASQAVFSFAGPPPRTTAKTANILSPRKISIRDMYLWWLQKSIHRKYPKYRAIMYIEGLYV